MQFLPDEKVIAEANGGLPVLTTHRLWHLSASGSEKQLRAILLEDLCSCSLTYQEKPLWLGLAILIACFGLIMAAANERQAGGILLGAGILTVIFLLLYKGSKRQYLNLAAASGQIAIQIPGDGFERGTGFVESVLAAKNERYLVGKRPEPLVRIAGA